MSSFMTVVRFTLFNRIRSKPFVITSIVMLLLISLGLNLPSIIDKLASGKPTEIGMIDDSAGIGRAVQNYFKLQEAKPVLEVQLIPPAGSADVNERALLEKLKTKEIKGYLLLVPGPPGSFPKPVYKAESIIGGDKKTKLEEALRLVKMDAASRSVGLSQEKLASLFGPVPIEAMQISSTGEQAGKTEAERNTAYALVYVLLFLLFMIVQMYGSLIASEITAEKSSRVMEIVITSVSPLKQMFGKITGMFLLGLIQIVLFVAAGAFNLYVVKNNRSSIEKLGLNLHTLDWSLLLYFLLFFVLGFFLYATLLAGVGSLVSRTEELGQALLPVTLLSLASFYISIFGLNNPNAGFVTAMSFVPFFTPMLMLLRIGMVGVPVWQIALGLVSLAAGIGVLGWFAAKLYRVGVLMYGKRPSIKEIARAMKAFKV